MKLFFLKINLIILINVYWLTRKSSYKYIQDGTSFYKGEKNKKSVLTTANEIVKSMTNSRVRSWFLTVSIVKISSRLSRWDNFNYYLIFILFFLNFWNCQVNDKFQGSELVPYSSNSEDILGAFPMIQF